MSIYYLSFLLSVSLSSSPSSSTMSSSFLSKFMKFCMNFFSITLFSKSPLSYRIAGRTGLTWLQNRCQIGTSRMQVILKLTLPYTIPSVTAKVRALFVASTLMIISLEYFAEPILTS